VPSDGAKVLTVGRHRFALGVFLAALSILNPTVASAGPPYVTDDPVPTDFRSWEIYTGVQYENPCCGAIPFAEINYGAMPNVQTSITLPIGFSNGQALQSFGFGATDFGIKIRFVQESDRRPQISFYPSVEMPSQRGEHVVTFLPLWLQKSWGRWTAFGGGGTYLNSSAGERNSNFVGGALERQLSSATALGA